MSKKRNTIKLLNFIIFLFFIFAASSPSNVKAEDSIEQFEELKESIRQGKGSSGNIFGYILGYAAIREDNLSLCKQLKPANAYCQATLDDIWHIRKFAEKKCDDIFPVLESLDPEETFDSESVFTRKKSLCEHIEDCDSLPKELANICYGFKNSRLSAWAMEKDPGDEPPEVQLGVYNGFKYGQDQKICELYVLGLEGKRAYICEVMFSDEALNDILDKIVEDLAYFELAQKSSSDQFCEKIKNATVKNACYSFPGIEGYFYNFEKF